MKYKLIISCDVSETELDEIRPDLQERGVITYLELRRTYGDKIEFEVLEHQGRVSNSPKLLYPPKVKDRNEEILKDIKNWTR